MTVLIANFASKFIFNEWINNWSFYWESVQLGLHLNVLLTVEASGECWCHFDWIFIREKWSDWFFAALAMFLPMNFMWQTERSYEWSWLRMTSMSVTRLHEFQHALYVSSNCSRWKTMREMYMYLCKIIWKSGKICNGNHAKYEQTIKCYLSDLSQDWWKWIN